MDALKKIMAHNELCDIVAEQHDKEAMGEMDMFAFGKVLDHQGPLKCSVPRYNGSSWNVKLLWEDGSITWEPLNVIAGSDAITLAAYAKENTVFSTFKDGDVSTRLQEQDCKMHQGATKHD